MIQSIHVKSVLTKVKNGPDPYFGTLYNMNLYRGCQHSCIYCDSRSSVYGIKNFKDVQVKVNAIDLLRKEIASKRIKGTISFGSMNDPYMPLEKQTLLVREALKIILEHRYPVHIITKSDLVLRDIDLLKQISKTYAAVSFSVSTVDDVLAKKIEPGATAPTKRLAALQTLSNHGIYTGIIYTPVLPFLTDSISCIEETINSAAAYKASYVLAWMGMTQRKGQREYYYHELDQHFPGIKNKYMKTFGTDYFCPANEHRKLEQKVKELLVHLHIPQRMIFFKDNSPEQLNLF